MRDARTLDAVPLSHIQEQLWLVEQLAAGTALYSEAVAVRLRGPLDVPALERSLGEIARRHEILRTVLPVIDGQPVQRVLPPSEIALPPRDVPGDELGEAARRLVERPFDTEAGPLFRCWLLRAGERDHALIVDVDHIVADAWSFAIVLDELRALYEAFAAGRPSPLPEPELQYADFAGWEKDLVATGILDADVAYWRERLAGVTPWLQVPADHPRPPLKGTAGARVECPLGDGLADPLLEAARRLGATPFTAVLALYGAVLSRLTGRTDLVVGTPVANRGRPELRGMVGNFANTLPLRLDLTGDPDLAELIARCRDRLLEAMDHQHLALGKIVELTAPERDASRTPLIQHTILLKERPLRFERMGEAEATWFEIPRTRGRLDAIVEVDLAPGRLRSWVEYDGAIFEEPTIAGLMAELGRVIEAWTANPSLRLSHLPPPVGEGRGGGTNQTPSPEVAPTLPSPTGEGSDGDPLLDLVTAAWRDVLGVPDVAPNDDFFRLGGHSMLATRLMQRVREPLGIDVPLRALWERSTPAGLTAEIRRRNPELDALLEQLRDLAAEEVDALLGRDAKPPGARPATFPLSFSQQHFWAMEERDPGSLTHTIPCSFRFRGAFDPEAYARAVNGVVARHEGLRTTIEQTPEGPVQRVHPHAEIDVPLLDLAGLPGAAREEEAARLRDVGAHRGFDLATGPLLAAHVVRVAPDDHRAMLSFHHMVTDEVSMSIVCRELSELYRAHVEGREHRLPALERHFGDFAAWEREHLAGPRLGRLEGFWRRQLRDAPVLEVPTDHPRQAQMTFGGESLSRREPLALLDAIGEVARRAHATPYVVFTAALCELLHRLSGQDDFVIGAPSENRTMPGSEHMVGCFLNVLPLRVDCSGDPTFLELVGRVRDALVPAYDHQALPLARIVEAVNPPRQPNRLPFFQTSCQMALAGWMPLNFPGTFLESFDIVSHGTARYDMAWHVVPKSDHLWLGLELNTDLWDRTSGIRFLSDLAAGLREVTDDPARRLSGCGFRFDR